MSELGIEDYAAVLIWLGIVSLYTTLLTVTALGVVFVLRKRRSSILKSQRAPRTPLSELEFNVATPTDTAKSRRVSFSKRMGVAEFATNEATTTWKNFYEAHNKSLESSNNDEARPSISHIGKRIFDQQFEEVEAIDFGGSVMQGNRADFNISMNNVNLTQQLAALECSVDKPTAPQQHFELSALTDHQSKVFVDDLTIPAINEMSNQINVNFSIVNPIENNKCDDLDEIERDLERSHNVVCSGPFRAEMSEYTEVDLNMMNMTHVAARNDESDMSITDTIHMPKVQEVSKSNVSLSKQGKPGDKDWVVDKENIAVINPYVTPRESDNFAINEVPNQVLVFDGKRLTIQSEKAEIPVKATEGLDKENYRQSEAPVKNTRKNIVLNVNDDLPNFVDEPMLPQHCFVGASAQELKQTMIFNEYISITDGVTKFNVVNECENTVGNISLTQAVSSNVILERKESERRRTILYEVDNGNMSVTQVVPPNIIMDDKPDIPSKRRTTVYDGNISFTQVVPANLIIPEDNQKSNKTIVYQDNMDITQALPNNIQLKKSVSNNKTVVFDQSIANISMTQVLPSNIISEKDVIVPNKRKTIVFNNDDGNISMTQAIPKNLILTESKEGVNKRKTIVFDNDNDDGNISMTQALPANIIQEAIKVDITNEPHKPIGVEPENLKESVVTEVETMNKREVSPKKRLTIMYDDDADISMTQALPANILSTSQLSKLSKKFDVEHENIFITQALPSNILIQEDVKENVVEDTLSPQNLDTSMAEVIPHKSILELKDIDNNSKINELGIEVKQNLSVSFKNIESKKEIGNLSMIKPIPDMFEIENDMLKADMDKFANLTQYGEKTLLQETIHDVSKPDVLVYQAAHDVKVEKLDDLKEEESNKSISIQKMESSPAKSTKGSLSPVSDEIQMDENDIEVQTNAQNENITPKESNLICHDTVNKISQERKDTKKSILHELLNMSSTSINDEDKITAAVVETNFENKPQSENNSNDGIFVITKESNENLLNTEPTESVVKILQDKENTVVVDKMNEIENKPLPAIEMKTDFEDNLESNLVELRRSAIHEKKKSPQNRYYEKVVSSDLQTSLKEDVMDRSNVKDFANLTKTRKSFKEADDTKELLDMLSDFTDRKSCAPIQEEDDKPKLRSSMALEHKDIPEPRRLSFAPKRQSIVLSREDLLNNLSMAQAALQQSRFEIDDSGSIEDTATESPPELNESVASPKKSVRMSTEVVKTLHFEDESCSDASLKSDVKVSPLKKTAFGETSYMKENRANVIPTYLKDVSDNIKALMTDLVKPRPDQLPFELMTNRAKKEPSTCSTQIQANLITSSQIDLEVELHSNMNSVYDLNKESLIVMDKSGEALSPVSTFDVSESNATESNEKHLKKSPLKKMMNQTPVLVFDHSNPLNNVLLAPPDCVDVHKYNPVSSESEGVDKPKDGKEHEVGRVITQYNVESRVGLPSGDACSDKKGDSHSLYSDPSKPLSINRSTDGIAMEVRDTEVNTLIVMKGNKELLEASSSLTLVDDALTQSVFDIKVKMQEKDDDSPVKVIYKLDNQEAPLDNIDSDLVSNDDEPMEYTKAKKRSYSPTRHKPSTLSTPDVTPKPLSKMQKISNSPNVCMNIVQVRHLSPEKSQTDSNSDDREEVRHKKRSPRKSKGSPKHKKPGTDITVQQLITEYKITQMEQDMIEEQIMEAIYDRMSSSGAVPETENTAGDATPDVVSSCTSNNQSGMRDGVKETVSYVGSQPSRVDWHPDLKGLSSKNVVTECDSGVNVVAKIDMLPFMGRECEWETSGGDTWMFRLLRSRLRLRVRLAHRHHNALRSRVRADTPVTEMCVDTVLADDKDPLAELCIRFAAEAMRYECGRGCSRAGDVPLALRRCAGVARVALRWARAMRDARARLAYTLGKDQVLALKVANIPLRSVWEVTMRLELVVEDAREAAWPRATDVRVSTVVADRKVGAAEVQRALSSLSHDWGHAPRAIWKIFRYLKNKTQDDDFLGLPM
ncbi:uncharacterized protein [Epargyreus clarus]|uniref:uncharacterized protein isoform X2 n=1 Tax=Epargyreus clarus TaxID=520877 RepID=UPI003C2D59B3